MATRRGLILHDGLTFLALLVVSLVLYGVTFFLFRSFESHRAELAKRWSMRGAAALAAGRSADAIVPLRAAIGYAPDDAGYQMQLAEALAGAGKTEEATNYFLNLWEARPGDGFLNLQLARLARKRGESQDATEYYRAAVYGVWQANALEERRAVRLELADYLMDLKDMPAARAELLVAAAAAPDTERLDLELGDRLRQTGDMQDAMSLYRKAVADAPRDRVALEAAGGTAYGLGEYGEAARLLRRAKEAKTTPGEGSELTAEQMETMTSESDRMMALSLSRDLPAHARAEHLMAAAAIAQARLAGCVASEGLGTGAGSTGAGSTGVGPAAAGAGAGAVRDRPTLLNRPTTPKPTSLDPPVPGTPVLPQASPLVELRARWKAETTAAARRDLRDDGVAQDGMQELIFATEEQTAAVCGAPTGDDALLLKMAQAARAAERQQ